MHDLFDLPPYDLVKLAKKLRKHGEVARKRMKKGPDCVTAELEGAIVCEWLAEHGPSRANMEQANGIIRNARLTISDLERKVAAKEMSISTYLWAFILSFGFNLFLSYSLLS